MIINTDFFDRNIIIYANSSVQILLLRTIVENLLSSSSRHAVTSLNLVRDCSGETKKIKLNQMHEGFKKLSDKSERPDFLYVPKLDVSAFGQQACFAKRKLEMFQLTKNSDIIQSDRFLNSISNKIVIKDCKLIHMKQFLDEYGVYLFNNEVLLRDRFIEQYQGLDECNIYNYIKNIKF